MENISNQYIKIFYCRSIGENIINLHTVNRKTKQKHDNNNDNNNDINYDDSKNVYLRLNYRKILKTDIKKSVFFTINTDADATICRQE